MQSRARTVCLQMAHSAINSICAPVPVFCWSTTLSSQAHAWPVTVDLKWCAWQAANRLLISSSLVKATRTCGSSEVSTSSAVRGRFSVALVRGWVAGTPSRRGRLEVASSATAANSLAGGLTAGLARLLRARNFTVAVPGESCDRWHPQWCRLVSFQGVCLRPCRREALICKRSAELNRHWCHGRYCTGYRLRLSGGARTRTTVATYVGGTCAIWHVLTGSVHAAPALRESLTRKRARLTTLVASRRGTARCRRRPGAHLRPARRCLVRCMICL